MIQHYREMLDDPMRLDAYRRAIEGAVRPGDVVAEVGCGLATYSIFAARAGAKKVYAIEEQKVATCAREVIAASGCADRVQLLNGRSTGLDPVERVDLVIFEDYIVGLLSPAIVAMLRDLRERWLKPGGRLLPARARVHAAAVESRDNHQLLDRFSDRGDRLFGIDYGAARRRAFATPMQLNLRPASLIAGSARVQELELLTLEECKLGGRGTGVVTRDGLIHGVLVWFEVELPPAGWLGTGPLDPPSAWRQTFLPFERPVAVKAGEAIELAVDAGPFGESIVWRWSVSTPAGQVAAHSLDGLLLGAEVLRSGRPDQVPIRGAELELDATILGSVDGSRDLAAIAGLVRARFPTRFASAKEAEACVARVLGRYRDRAGSSTEP